MSTHARRDPMMRRDWLTMATEKFRGAGPTPTSPMDAPLSGLPPALIQVGTDDILYSDSERLHERMQAAGVPCEIQRFDGLWHVFQLYAGILRDANQALDAAGEFLRTTWNASNASTKAPRLAPPSDPVASADA